MTHLLWLIKSGICHVVNQDLHGGKPVNKSVKCGFVFTPFWMPFNQYLINPQNKYNNLEFQYFEELSLHRPSLLRDSRTVRCNLDPIGAGPWIPVPVIARNPPPDPMTAMVGVCRMFFGPFIFPNNFCIFFAIVRDPQTGVVPAGQISRG